MDSKKLINNDNYFINSFVKDGYRPILATNNEENLSKKIDNCRIIYFDLKDKKKLHKFISIIRPIKIIEQWKKS